MRDDPRAAELLDIAASTLPLLQRARDLLESLDCLPSATRTVSKSAQANGSGVTIRGAAAKKANPAQTQPPKPANVAPPGQSDTIRAWARSHGMQLADAGRMSAAVIAA